MSTCRTTTDTPRHRPAYLPHWCAPRARSGLQRGPVVDGHAIHEHPVVWLEFGNPVVTPSRSTRDASAQSLPCKGSDRKVARQFCSMTGGVSGRIRTCGRRLGRADALASTPAISDYSRYASHHGRPEAWFSSSSHHDPDHAFTFCERNSNRRTLRFFLGRSWKSVRRWYSERSSVPIALARGLLRHPR
jgi:hypothetical protein